MLKLQQLGTAAIMLIVVLTVLQSRSTPEERANKVFATNTERPRIELSPQLIAQREHRTALVIGNGAYGAEGKLNNPPNDATDVAKALRELGFEVTLLKDVDKRQIEDEINQFNSRLRQGGVGLFYYAGHGVQVNGENYLIPIAAKISREQDVAYEAVPLGRILGAMEDAGNPVNIVLIDACRSNNYSRGWRSGLQGLAFTQSAKGTFVSFATAPGKVARDGDGRNSPYTASLLQYIQEPGVPVELLFKYVRQSVIDKTKGEQTPWESSSLTGNFAFKPTAPIPSPVPSIPSEPTLISKATGVNYTRLWNLLKAGEWKEADAETMKVILQAAGQTSQGWLRVEDVDRFSCEDLRIVDRLWVDASDGKFGISVQSQIYRGLGGTRGYDAGIWDKFGDKVGWRRGGSWLNYSDLTFNLSGSSGHLPTLVGGDVWGSELSWWGWGITSRAASCNL